MPAVITGFSPSDRALSPAPASLPRPRSFCTSQLHVRGGALPLVMMCIVYTPAPENLETSM